MLLGCSKIVAIPVSDSSKCTTFEVSDMYLFDTFEEPEQHRCEFHDGVFDIFAHKFCSS